MSRAVENPFDSVISGFLLYGIEIEELLILFECMLRPNKVGAIVASQANRYTPTVDEVPQTYNKGVG